MGCNSKDGLKAEDNRIGRFQDDSGSMIRSGPPRLILRIFRWYCHPMLADHIEGDLIEVHQAWMRSHGRWMANIRLAAELVLLFRPGIIRPWQSPRFVTTYSMYKSFVIVAWRNFLKTKGYSSINIFGLAIALTACMLILLYVRHELSYDRFNEHADRIYQVNNEIKFGDNHIDVACAAPAFGASAKQEIPQVEQTTRLRWFGSLLIKKDNELVRQNDVAYADSTLFDVFTIPFISGNPKKALSEPNSIVLTESIARKFFGTTAVLGKHLMVENNKVRTITGVVQDIPSNCHFRFQCFVPMVEDERANNNDWSGGQNYHTYLLLRTDADLSLVERELNVMMNKHLGPELKMLINKTIEEFEAQGDYFRATLTNLPDIHLHSNRMGELYGSGKVEYVYMFSAIAVFIMIIAIINFMNLSTARSANRAREVGVRKVLGSLKTSLVQQFILESILTSTLSMIIAIGMTTMILPQFNDLTGKSFDTAVLYAPATIGSLIVMILIVGLLAGSYPAFYLSAFQPATVLKGSKGGSRRSFVRNTLVVLQFAASVTLIAFTIVTYLQMDYIRHRDLGFDREQVLIINNISQVENRVESLKNSLLAIQGVDQATVSGFLPVNYMRSNNTFFKSPTLDIAGAISMQAWTVDDQYVPTMSMSILEGRNFSEHIISDSTAIVLNESAARFLGGKDIIGMKLFVTNDLQGNVTAVRVIGIVKDFHFSTLREQVGPLALVYRKSGISMALKLNTDDVPSLMDKVARSWKTLMPEAPFEYSFMDEDFDRLYTGERQAGTLFTIFSSLSIFISCLGLFGLAAFMAEQRSKEIGIRKVLGASVYGITSLLSRDFLRLVLLAVVLATPLAWLLIGKWLEGFAYRVDIVWWIFPLAGMLAVVIACLTVTYQSIRAAVTNPVNSLRTE